MKIDLPITSLIIIQSALKRRRETMVNENTGQADVYVIVIDLILKDIEHGLK